MRVRGFVLGVNRYRIRSSLLVYTVNAEKFHRLFIYLICIVMLINIRDYNEWCKQYLREIVPKEKEKKKIENALRCYIE